MLAKVGLQISGRCVKFFHTGATLTPPNGGNNYGKESYGYR